MTLIITRKNGKTYNLSDLGIRVIEFEPESLNIVNNYNKISGGAYVVQGNGYDARYINILLQLNGNDINDYAMSRSEVFSLFSTTEEFEVVDEKEPYKKWSVRSDGNFSVGRNVKSGTFDLVLICNKPFAESIINTTQLPEFKEWDSNTISWGMGFDYDNESEIKYNFNQNQFSVNNFGTAEIDPTISKLKITIRGNGNNIIMRNVTNGTEYRYNGTLNNGEELVIDGVMSKKNNISVFRNTNKKLIELSTGKNDIILEGMQNLEIYFDFNFQYK